MASIASTSKLPETAPLALGPSLDSADNTQDQRVAAKKNPLLYGYDNIATNTKIDAFVKKATKNDPKNGTTPRRNFRHLSRVLQGLPWKSDVTMSKSTLTAAVMGRAQEVKKGEADKVLFRDLRHAAENVDIWESSVFAKKYHSATERGLIRARKTVTRKLLLVKSDSAQFPPLALAEQVFYFKSINKENLAHYLSLFTSFIAFDLIASYAIPTSMIPLPPNPEAAPYARFALPEVVIKGYRNILGPYQSNMAKWIDRVTRPRENDSDVGKRGIFDMISEAYGHELEGVTMCNIGSFVLAMKYLAVDPPAANSEFLLDDMTKTLIKQAKEGGYPLPSDFYDAEGLDCLIAFLCVSLISPLCLFSGQRLYGPGSAMNVEWPFMIWQQVAQVQRPAWVIKRERQIIGLLWTLAKEWDTIDGVTAVLNAAQEWKQEDELDPPDATDRNFFVNLLICSEEKRRQKDKKKKKMKRRRGQLTDGVEGSKNDSEADSGSGSGTEEEGHEPAETKEGSIVHGGDPLFLTSGSSDAAMKPLLSNQESGRALSTGPVPIRNAATPYETNHQWPATEAGLKASEDADKDAANANEKAARSASVSSSSSRFQSPPNPNRVPASAEARAQTPLDDALHFDQLSLANVLTEDYDPFMPDLVDEEDLDDGTAPMSVDNPVDGVLDQRDLHPASDGLPLRDQDVEMEDGAPVPTSRIPLAADDDLENVKMPPLPASHWLRRANAKYSQWVTGGQGPVDIPRAVMRKILGTLYSEAEWEELYELGMADDVREGWNESKLLNRATKYLLVLLDQETDALRPRLNMEEESDEEEDEADGCLPDVRKRKRDDSDAALDDADGDAELDVGSSVKKARTDGQQDFNSVAKETPLPKRIPERIEETDSEAGDSVRLTAAPTEKDSMSRASPPAAVVPAADLSTGMPRPPSETLNPNAAPSLPALATRSSPTRDEGGETMTVVDDLAARASSSPTQDKGGDAANAFPERDIQVAGPSGAARGPSSERTASVNPQRAGSRRPSRLPAVLLTVERQYQPQTLTRALSTIKQEWRTLEPCEIESDIEIFEVMEGPDSPDEEEGDEDMDVQARPIVNWGKSIKLLAMGAPREVTHEATSDIEDGEYQREDSRKFWEMKEPPKRDEMDYPSDSDRDYKFDEDSEGELSKDPDDVSIESPYMSFDEDPNDRTPVKLYEVRAGIPRTVYWRARNTLLAIDEDAREVNFGKDIDWLKQRTIDDWMALRPKNIDDSFARGDVNLLRGTNVNAGWVWGMECASRIISPAQHVEVQDFCNRHKATGVYNHPVSLRSIVDRDYRDSNKVLNMLDAPQNTPLVQIPRSCDIDFGTMAWKNRQEILRGDNRVTIHEHNIDWRIQRGLNWGIISQQHAVSLGHVDTAGVFTAIAILDGIKYWAIRKTALDPGRKGGEKDVNDIEYFVDLNDRDISELEGGATEWLPVILFPGDVLIIPPNARHVVFTIKDTLMAGIHFYHYTNLERSTCGFIVSRFSTHHISNAEHPEFLSILQSFATFWAPTFSKGKAARFSLDNPAMRSKPHPATSEYGLSNLVSIAITLVFNATLSGVETPYRGLYYETDRLNFKKMWAAVSKDGYIDAQDLNYDPDMYQEIIAAELGSEGGPWDDRWTCAGLGPVLIHVGRAMVALSQIWDEQRDKEFRTTYDGETEEIIREDDMQYNEYLTPDHVYKRVISDLVVSLCLDKPTVTALVGTLDECYDVEVTTIVPKVEWVSEPGRQTRPPGLWLTHYAPTVKKEVKKSSKGKNVAQKGQDEDEDDFSDDLDADDEADATFGSKRTAKKSNGKSKSAAKSKARKR